MRVRASGRESFCAPLWTAARLLAEVGLVLVTRPTRSRADVFCAGFGHAAPRPSAGTLIAAPTDEAAAAAKASGRGDVLRVDYGLDDFVDADCDSYEFLLESDAPYLFCACEMSGRTPIAALCGALTWAQKCRSAPPLALLALWGVEERAYQAFLHTAEGFGLTERLQVVEVAGGEELGALAGRARCALSVLSEHECGYVALGSAAAGVPTVVLGGGAHLADHVVLVDEPAQVAEALESALEQRDALARAAEPLRSRRWKTFLEAVLSFARRG